MSNFRSYFRFKETGSLHEVDCLDDYFGPHKYGYRPLIYGNSTVLTEKQFDKEYDRVEQLEMTEQSGVPMTNEVKGEYSAEIENNSK